MTKSKENRGPYINAALLCEKVLEEKDSVLSIVRLINQLVHTQKGADAPQKLPKFSYRLFCVCVIKAGDADGKHILGIKLKSPADKLLEKLEFPFAVQNGAGANIIMEMNLTFSQVGLYWFEVYLDSELATKIPLTIVYNRIA